MANAEERSEILAAINSLLSDWRDRALQAGAKASEMDLKVKNIDQKITEIDQKVTEVEFQINATDQKAQEADRNAAEVALKAEEMTLKAQAAEAKARYLLYATKICIVHRPPSTFVLWLAKNFRYRYKCGPVTFTDI